MPDEYGVNLHPETKTEISLKSRSYSRLAAPFSSRCIRGWEDTEYSKVQLRNRGAYTIQVWETLLQKTQQNYLLFYRSAARSVWCRTCRATAAAWRPTTSTTSSSSSGRTET